MHSCRPHASVHCLLSPVITKGGGGREGVRARRCERAGVTGGFGCCSCSSPPLIISEQRNSLTFSTTEHISKSSMAMSWPSRCLSFSLVWITLLDIYVASVRADNVQLDTTLPMSAETFAQLARSQEFYRSTRAETKLSKQQVMELGDWVVWEFQNEDEEAPRSGGNSEEVVPHPPLDRISPACLGLEGGGLEGTPGNHPSATTGQAAQQTAVVADTKMQVVRNLRRMYAAASSPTRSPPQPDGAGAQTAVSVAHNMFSDVVARRLGPFLRPDRQQQQQQQQQQRQGEPQQMYRKVRLKYVVSSPIGSSQNEGTQGHTLREGEDEVTYTETDCISGLPMFRGNLVVKTTFRVTRSEHDPENSVRVKVCVVVGDVKLSKAIAWLSKGVKHAIRDSGMKQAAQTLQDMVEAKSKAWL